MEGAPLEVKGLAALTPAPLTSAQGAEVLGRFGHAISEELHHDHASWLPPDLYVEEHQRVGAACGSPGDRGLRVLALGLTSTAAAAIPLTAPGNLHRLPGLPALRALLFDELN